MYNPGLPAPMYINQQAFVTTFLLRSCGYNIDASRPASLYDYLNNTLEFITGNDHGNLIGYRCKMNAGYTIFFNI